MVPGASRLASLVAGLVVWAAVWGPGFVLVQRHVFGFDPLSAAHRRALAAAWRDGRAVVDSLPESLFVASWPAAALGALVSLTVVGRLGRAVLAGPRVACAMLAHRPGRPAADPEPPGVASPTPAAEGLSANDPRYTLDRLSRHVGRRLAEQFRHARPATEGAAPTEAAPAADAADDPDIYDPDGLFGDDDDAADDPLAPAPAAPPLDDAPDEAPAPETAPAPPAGPDAPDDPEAERYARARARLAAVRHDREAAGWTVYPNIVARLEDGPARVDLVLADAARVVVVLVWPFTEPYQTDDEASGTWFNPLTGLARPSPVLRTFRIARHLDGLLHGPLDRHGYAPVRRVVLAVSGALTVTPASETLWRAHGLTVASARTRPAVEATLPTLQTAIGTGTGPPAPDLADALVEQQDRNAVMVARDIKVLSSLVG